ncbi:MAG: DUF480 domain-containing protein [Thermoguttaceae bacterium]
MTEPSSTEPPTTTPQHRWQPLGAIDRRVLGVLGEKAKTTPDGYPMSLNSVCTGCNQKSNRWPLMEIEPDQVEESLDRLRALGAVALVEGGGRVQKYRHYLYEWLGVDKVESAVMIELLLRGDQTVGELRSRAARMEPIADLAALQPVVDSLKAKGLVLGFTPPGRGHVVSHALYSPREIESLREKYRGGAPVAQPRDDTDSTSPVRQPAAVGHPAAVNPSIEELRRDLADLRQQVAQIRDEVDHIRKFVE